MLRILAEPFAQLLRYAPTFFVTLKDEIRRRHAGSLLGLLWLAITPAVFLVIYAVVYIVIFRVKPGSLNQYEYTLLIFCGLMSFIGFSEAISAGAISLTSHRAILLNTVFPSELIPLRSVLAGSVTAGVGLVIAMALSPIIGHASMLVLLAPAVLLLQIMFVAGLSWFLSPIQLVLRDLQQIISLTVMGLMVLSPIAYSRDMVPSQIALLIYLNPLSYFIIGLQSLLLEGRPPPPGIVLAMLLLGFGTFVAGFWFYRRVKTVFSDYA